MTTKLQLLTLSIIMILAATVISCGKAAPLDPDATAESPGIKKTQVGTTYDMVQATDPVRNQQVTVNQGEMSLTLTSSTTATGTYNCYVGGVFKGTVQYLASVKWDMGSTLYVTSLRPSITGCVSNRYFGFKTQMKFAFSTDKKTLQINDLGLTQTTVFNLRN